MLNRVDLNQFPHQGELDRFALAPQGEIHRRARFAADQFYRVLGGHALGTLTVDGGDHILGLHTGA